MEKTRLAEWTWPAQGHPASEGPTACCSWCLKRSTLWIQRSHFVFQRGCFGPGTSQHPALALSPKARCLQIRVTPKAHAPCVPCVAIWEGISPASSLHFSQDGLHWRVGGREDFTSVGQHARAFLSSVILLTPLRGGYSFPHLPDEEASLQRSKMTCPRSHSDCAAEPRFELISIESQDLFSEWEWFFFVENRGLLPSRLAQILWSVFLSEYIYFLTPPERKRKLSSGHRV